MADGRPFFNVAGFGFDTAVIEDSRRKRFWRGRLVYFLSALRQLGSYRGFDLRMTADGNDLGAGLSFMLIVANARHFGGVFRIAPAADPSDGLLDAVLFRNGPLRRRLAVMKRLIDGTHDRAPEVTITRSRSLHLSFAEAPSYEVDGEWYRAENKDIEITVIPGALRVLAPPGP
jgi:diacylglycerol kinase (ATP)